MLYPRAAGKFQSFRKNGSYEKPTVSIHINIKLKIEDKNWTKRYAPRRYANTFNQIILENKKIINCILKESVYALLYIDVRKKAKTDTA